MNIYTVSVFENLSKRVGIDGDIRCFGYFENYSDAENVLVKNTTDLHETIYNYGVIENYESGLNPLALDRVFFKYNKELDLFIQIEEPRCLEHYVNFVMG